MTTLTMSRGDTASWDLAVLDRAGAPLNLTGWSIYATFKRSLDEPDPGFAQLTIGSGITVTNAAGGQAVLAFTRAQTNTLVENTVLLFDIQLSTAVPETTSTVLSGILVINRDATRAP